MVGPRVDLGRARQRVALDEVDAHAVAKQPACREKKGGEGARVEETCREHKLNPNRMQGAGDRCGTIFLRDEAINASSLMSGNSIKTGHV